MDVDAEQVQVRDGWYVQPLSADAASTELTGVQCMPLLLLFLQATVSVAKRETWLQMKDVHSQHPDGRDERCQG